MRIGINIIASDRGCFIDRRHAPDGHAARIDADDGDGARRRMDSVGTFPAGRSLGQIRRNSIGLTVEGVDRTEQRQRLVDIDRITTLPDGSAEVPVPT